MKKVPLWMLSVETTAEAEGAVVEFLEQLFAQPASVYVDEETQATAVRIFAREKSAFPERSRAALAAGLKRIQACGLDVGAAKVAFKKLPPENWAESWKRHFRPIQIGPDLLIKPSWSKRQPRRGQAVVVIDPGLSFGTGQHPTTAFCLGQLAKKRRPGTAQSLLDVGTGSGILAIAAANLGYKPVDCFDIDPDAIRTARANARLNGMQAKLKLVRRDLTRLPATSRLKYDVICANLVADLLLSEKARLLNRLQAGGTLILAGLLHSQFPAVRQAYEAAGLRLASQSVSQEWQSGAFITAERS